MDKAQLLDEIETLGLEIVVGLESHIRLNTDTKLFCACPNLETETPNTHVCPVCTGQVGALPRVNTSAIAKALQLGKAVESTLSHSTIGWERKHYHYPDLPKNFQLTQFNTPIIPDGAVRCFRDDGSEFVVTLEQVHIEEDAAKLLHLTQGSQVDFNKSGVPLVEVVTKPCIHKLEDAATYAQYLQRLVQSIGISEANLEKGEFKSDVSVSLRKKGTTDLHARAEIKNLNSFRFMSQAVYEEVDQQLAYYKEHEQFRPQQVTVLWDEVLKKTRVMRDKEYAADYRYSTEPDITPVDIRAMRESTEIDLDSLPYTCEKMMIEKGVRPQDAKFFTSNADRVDVFVTIHQQISEPLFIAKLLLNHFRVDEYSYAREHKQTLAQLFEWIATHNPPATIVQDCIKGFKKNSTFDYAAHAKALSLSDDDQLTIIDEVIDANPSIADAVRKGDTAKAGILVGKVMKKTDKQLSGKLVREKIIDILLPTETPAKKSTSDDVQRDENIHSTDKEVEVRPQRVDIDGIQSRIKEDYQTYKISEIDNDSLSIQCTLAGWVTSVRDHGELIFIDLRDSNQEIFQLRLSREHISDLDEMARIKPESVIMATGRVIQREEDDFNPSIRTGKVELDTHHLTILNPSQTLPFEIKRSLKTKESKRFEYRYLDHRHHQNHKTIVNRYKVLKLIRDYLDKKSFIEIETPLLTAGTDEGAREFIVPSRKHSGQFYTLPQAPQQFKQMLMVSGYEKYFQIARCFRDEDSRGDRQPEFTQLDIEMSFVNASEVMELNTKLLELITSTLYGRQWEVQPVQTLTYREAMDKYGTDRPDLRYGLEMDDITDIVRGTSFQVFASAIESGGIVKCIRVSEKVQRKRLSKGQIETLTSIAIDEGLGGLAYIIINHDGLQSPIIKFLGEDICQQIIDHVDAQVGDIVFFSAAVPVIAYRALDAVRQALADILNLIPPKVLCPAWIIDFPMYEKKEDGGYTFSHNPFSMPQHQFLPHHMAGQELETVLAKQYDFVLNGHEIAGGSIRAHIPEVMEATFRNMGHTHEQMRASAGALYDALHYGAPPHGGIAWGIDRLLMILEKKKSIREVMAFPKTTTGEDLLFGSPSTLSPHKISEANIKIN